MSLLAPMTGPIRVARHTRAQRPLVVASAVVLISVVAFALLAPVLAPYDPDTLDLANPYAGLSLQHPLGTDSSGRDTLSRLMFGARVSLLAPLVAVIVSTVLGILLGLAAGWLGGFTDWLIGRTLDIVLSFPGLLLAILIVALFGPGVVGPTAAMAIAYSPYVARLVRSLVVAERVKPYVAAYRVQGFGGAWVALRRVLPNVSPAVLAQSSLNFGYVLMDLAALSFLGLGVQAPTSDWGSMVNASGAAVLAGHPLSAFVPAVTIILVVVSISVLGQELADRVSGRRGR
jgi:ABC-type dipeptide/oligopeptide/nickel transport system permease subunit